MPCGGIYPMLPAVGNVTEELLLIDGGCWVCSKGGCFHFMEEWDTLIHARCAVKALADPSSDTYLVVTHGHEVILDFSLEEDGIQV